MKRNKRSLDKLGKFGIVTAIALLALLSLGIGSFAHANSATLSTDQTDYSPGQTVQITGTGWHSGATVYVSVTRPDQSVQTCSSPNPGSFGFQSYCSAADSSLIGTLISR